jgi:hypothetical protein
VSGTKSKNTEQSNTIATQGAQIEGIEADLLKTKEKLTDTDAKQAGEAAKAADQKAGSAQQAGRRRPNTASGRGAHHFAVEAFGVNVLRGAGGLIPRLAQLASESSIERVLPAQLTTLRRRETPIWRRSRR